MAKKIPLTRGKYAIVDDEDFDYLSQWKWCLGGWGYAVRTATAEERKDGFPKTIKMHRAIMDLVGKDPRIKVDHINGNKLDNRRENLRICSNAENLRNTGKQRNNSTGYKGVSYNKKKELFQARIRHNYKIYFLGYYNDPKEAAYAYDVAAKLLHGEFFNGNNVQIDAHKAQQIEAYVIRRLVKKGLIDAA